MSTSTVFEGIAVIGMAGRFPKADSIDEYWDNLAGGRDCFTETSVDELVALGLPRRVAEDPNVVRRCPRVLHPRAFDRHAFGMTSEEVNELDPQERVLLECIWHALENAGYDPYRVDGLVGLWAGLGFADYPLRSLNALYGPFPGIVDPSSAFSEPTEGHLARVARTFGLNGPVVNVQTACSTGLVAVHMACQSLLTYQCDLALAGAVSLQYTTLPIYLYAEGEIFSSDGCCRAFDKKASGTVLGDGCGIIALRRVEDAVASQDRILAVIRGTAINNDGATRAGYTAPGVAGQMEVIAAAQAAAGVSARDISYVEAHGTGTNLGDPIEVSALTKAFRATTEEIAFCGIGSVKTNVGHLDAAAGVAGLIKTVCAIRNRKLPPTLHYTEPNPALNLASSPFYIVDHLQDWIPGQRGRIAAVSSFGLGGTNAHVIVEEFLQQVEGSGSGCGWCLLVVSAATASALDVQCSRLADHLRKNEESLDLLKVAGTLRNGRQTLKIRRCVVADTVPAAAAQLEKPGPLHAAFGVAESAERPVVFMFSGQGAQYPGMGLGLYLENSVFRESMDTCSRIAGQLQGHGTLLDILYGGGEANRALLNETAFAQPALFAIEYSLARVWESRGVRPAAVVGHSIGEYAAACEARVFSLEDSMNLVCQRGSLMQNLEAGAMLAVLCPEPEVRSILPHTLDIGVINGPGMCVVSGPEREIERFDTELEARGIGRRRLRTSHAFHSRMMDAAVDGLAEVARSVARHAPCIPVGSNSSGDWLSDQDATDAGYWARHMRATVHFGQNLATVARSFPWSVLLELGPGSTLCGIARQGADGVRALPSVPSLRQVHEVVADDAHLLRAVGALWCHGAVADVPESPGATGSRGKVGLPNYPFEGR